MNKTLLPLLLCLLTLGASACVPAEHVGTITRRVDADGVRVIRVITGSGDLEIVGGDTLTVEAVADVYAAVDEEHERSGDDGCDCAPEDAPRVDERDPLDDDDRPEATRRVTTSPLGEYVDFTLERSGDVVTLRVDPRGWRSTAHVRVTVPRRLIVDLDDGSGDVVIEHVGGLTGVDGSGRLSAYDIGGDVRLTDGSGDLRVEAVTGDVTITDGSGELAVVDVDGRVEITDGSGDLCVARAANVSVTDGSGDIHTSEVGRLRVIEGGSGDITNGPSSCR